MSLPNLPYGDSLRREVWDRWGGIDYNQRAGDGDLADSWNLSTREYPLLASRRKRYESDFGVKGRVTAFGALDKLYWVTDGKFYYDGAEKGTLTAGEKQIAAMNGRLYIFPDKKVYDTAADTLTDMEASASVTEPYLENGSIYGVPAEDNTLRAPGTDWAALGFKAGDSVTLSGCVLHPENNKTLIIREVQGDKLRFDEYALELGSRYTWTKTWATGDAGSIPSGQVRFRAGTAVLSFRTPRGSAGSAETVIGKTPDSASGGDLTDGDEPFSALLRSTPAPSLTMTYDGEMVHVSIPEVHYSVPKTIEVEGRTVVVYDTVDYAGYSARLPVATYMTGAYTDLSVDASPVGLAQYQETGTVTVQRSVPDLDFVCANENRLWGCKGDTIYASKLGDPLNFSVFDNLSTDSWQAETGTPGDFTACVSFQGYPIFFKDYEVFRVLGDRAEDFTFMPAPLPGVRADSARSLAQVADTLYYLSDQGVCAYRGSYPTIVSEALGYDVSWRFGCAGGNGRRYYISMRRAEEQTYYLFSYDTRWGVWHREDHDRTDAGWVYFAERGRQLYMLDDGWRSDGQGGTEHFVTILDPSETPPEGYSPEEPEKVPWEVTFAPFTRVYKEALSGSEGKKGLLRLLIRCRREAPVAVYLRYDDGEWELLATFGAGEEAGTDTYVVPLILRRCDRWALQLRGEGDTVIYSIAPEKYGGSWHQARGDSTANGLVM